MAQQVQLKAQNFELPVTLVIESVETGEFLSKLNMIKDVFMCF